MPTTGGSAPSQRNLVIKLGQRLNKVLAESTGIVVESPLEDDDMITWTDGIGVTYGRLVLPNARFVSATVYSGIVVGLTVCPHERYIGIDEAFSLVYGLAPAVEATKEWTGGVTTDFSVVHIRLKEPGRQRVKVANWTSSRDADALSITIEKRHDSASSFPMLADIQPALCLVTVQISNDEIRDRALDVLVTNKHPTRRLGDAEKF